MSLVTRHRRALANDLDILAHRMGRIFGGPDTDFPSFGSLAYGTGWVPPVSVEERSNELLLTAELPGMSEDAVEIGLENGVLTISGNKAEPGKEGDSGTKFHLVERRFGSFRRSFTLPRTVRADDITASFDQGLLTVRLPKAEGAVSRKIKVSRG